MSFITIASGVSSKKLLSSRKICDKPLYDTIVAESEYKAEFNEWKRRKQIYDGIMNDVARHFVKARFRPWKERGLSYGERYRSFIKYYKVYYVAKKVMKVALNDIVFVRKLEGDELMTAFCNILAGFGMIKPESMISRIAKSKENDNNDGDGDVNGDGNSDNNQNDVTDACVSEYEDDDEDKDKDEDVADACVSEDDDEDKDVADACVSEDEDEDEDYDSDEAYDINMFPGYSRRVLRDTAPTFTYTKNT